MSGNLFNDPRIIIWDFEIQMDYLLPFGKTDEVLFNKKKQKVNIWWHFITGEYFSLVKTLNW